MFIIKLFKDEPETSKALIVLSLIGLSIFIDYSANGYTATTIMVSYLASLINFVFSIFCIRYIRGNKKALRKTPHIESSLTTWNYVWRGYLLFMFSLVCAGLAGLAGLVFVPGGHDVGSAVYVFWFSIVPLFFMPVVCWVLFSSDRKGQLRWVLSSFRGY